MRHVIIALAATAAIAAPASAQQRPVAAPSISISTKHIVAPAIDIALQHVAHAVDVPVPHDRRPPESWAPQDPADSLWRAAREALNRGEHNRAAQLYNRIRTESRFARSEYRVPSWYWEAFAREKINTDAELRNAHTILVALKREHPRYEGMAEAERLAANIDGQLARRGDSSAATRIGVAANQAGAQNQQCDETQMFALEALMHMPTAEAMPILKRVMERRGCDKMREQAIFIISQKRSAEAEEIMLNAVRNDPSPDVRKAAVFWLSQVNSDRAVDALDNIIRTATDKQLLESAVFALSQNRSDRATAMLRELATRANTPAEVRRNAIFWLGQRNDPAIGGLLRSLYAQSTDNEMKDVILFAASQRRDSANARFLMDIALNDGEDVELRKKALFWASQQRVVPVNKLGELYRTMPNIEMKKQVLFALTQTRDPEAVTQLIEIARTERDTQLRKDAIFWLGQSRDPRAARFLAELIGG